MHKAFTIILALLLVHPISVRAASDEVLNTIKAALPQPPAGWMVAGEGSAAPPDQARGAAGRVRYTVHYKRVAGFREERRRLDEAYAESSRRNNEEAKPQIDELIKQQTEVSLALRKATRRRNAAEEKRLNEALEENGSKMRALHAEVDRKISLDVAPYVIRDAEAGISIAVNEGTAELRRGENIALEGAAFALYRPGAPLGTTGWKPGELLVLYGDWRSQGDNVFRAASATGSEVRTIAITITGEQARAEQLLKHLDLKRILSLVK